MTNVDMRTVIPAAAMVGEDAEETELLRASLREAAAFLESYNWCHGIMEAYFGLGIGGVVAVFLFRIDAPPSVDEWLWIVTGDVPPCYLVTEDASTPLAALEIYCDLMQDWVAAVRSGRPLNEVVPVDTAPTERNAAALHTRISFVRKEVIPMFNSSA
jgi:hypothetical protein